MQSIISKYSSLPLLLLFFCSLMLTSCLDSTSSSQERENLVETAKSVTDQQTGDQVLSTFVDLLEQTHDSTFATEGLYTAIIPLDSAFAALPSGTLDTLSNEALTEIVEYHMVDNIVQLNQLNTEEDVASLQGEDLLFEISSNPSTNSNQFFVNDGQLLGSFNASNGVIYIVDTVLFPDAYLNVFGLISKRYELNELEEAIEDVNFASTLEDETAEYTVFAPSDEALDGTTPSGSEIEYHILEEKLSSNELSSQTYTTMSGQELTVDVSGSTITINGDAAVTTMDFEGTNGVVHIIDGVLEAPSE